MQFPVRAMAMRVLVRVNDVTAPGDVAVDDASQRLRDDVAVEVMAWMLAPRQWAYSDEADIWHADADTPLLTRHAWRPDANDAQSMQVLDRMTALGYHGTIDASTTACHVRFSRGDVEASASSAGRREALLLAALAAIRADGGAP